LNPLLVNVQAQVSVKAHVLIGHPHQGEAANQVSPPVVKQKFVAGDDEKDNYHIVAEAVLAGEDKETLTKDKVRIVLTLRDAVFARLAEYFLVGDRPCHAGNRDCQQKKPDDLQVKRHS